MKEKIKDIYIIISPILIGTAIFFSQLTGNIVKEIIIIVGEILIDTAIGETIEVVLDNVFGNSQKVEVATVIPDNENPLKGTLSKPFKIEGKTRNSEKSTTKIELVINKIRMKRNDIKNENWYLAPDVKQLLTQVFKKEFNEPVNIKCSQFGVGIIVPNPINKLKGTYSTTMTIDATSKSGEKIIFKIDKPAMVRKDTTSDWKLAPDLEEILEQVTKNYEAKAICNF